MSTQIRKYELKARAESQRETRNRIAEVAAELHEEKGVARTTVSEIARRAGVTRLTVYNHFADLSELIPACAAHYAESHPVPDFESALSIEEPGERLREGLGRLYAWYREIEPMFGKLFSDRVAVPELDEFMRGSTDVLQANLAGEMAAAFRARGKKGERLTALTRLAVDFSTWQRLTEAGLADADAAELMTASVTSYAAG